MKISFSTLKDIVIKTLAYIKSALSEADGTGSATRLTGTWIGIILLTYVHVMVFSLGKHPELASSLLDTDKFLIAGLFVVKGAEKVINNNINAKAGLSDENVIKQ